MIRTIPLPFEQVLKKIPSGAVVGIIGCGDCAAVLGTGGTRQVELWKTQVERTHSVPFATVIESPCDQRSLRGLLGLIKGFEAPEYLLLLACPAGAQSLVDLPRTRGDHRPVLIGLTGDGPGWIDGRKKDWHPCRMCNPCLHEPEVGPCKISECPLERVDGPCQNRLRENACPLEPGKQCVWIGAGDCNPALVRGGVE